MPKHHAHFRDPHDCTFYERHNTAFEENECRESKQTFVIDYQGLDWVRVCVLEKKGLVSKILRLIALSIVGGQRRKVKST